MRKRLLAAVLPLRFGPAGLTRMCKTCKQERSFPLNALACGSYGIGSMVARTRSGTAILAVQVSLRDVQKAESLPGTSGCVENTSYAPRTRTPVVLLGGFSTPASRPRPCCRTRRRRVSADVRPPLRVAVSPGADLLHQGYPVCCRSRRPGS